MSQNYSYAKGSVTGTGVICQLGTEDMNAPIGVLVGNTFVGTVLVEVSNDPEAAVPVWVPFGAGVTTPGTVKVDIPVKGVRARCSAYTSGTLSAYIAGAMGST